MNEITSIENQIRKWRVVPVAVVEKVDDGCRMAEALMKGGLGILEITLRTGAAREALSQVRKNFPDILLGAGTILDSDSIPQLLEDGIDFGISPGLDEAVIDTCLELSFPLLPGVATPTEISRALALGCKQLKFFPAEVAGGVAALKAIAAPFRAKGVSFLPTGGITFEKAKAYLDLPEVDAVGGSWLVSGQLISSGNFEKISFLASEALNLADSSK
tara:strand:- start:544 stop:1194 length:651 start_codon:yes stop_codon:yes gene_type:complete